MKFLQEKIEITPDQDVSWEEIESLRLLNGKLILVLKNQTTLEIKDLNPKLIDLAFRSYERFLQQRYRH
ncbi:MAG: hypothetical protein JSS62_00720 [Verrucomicrobia bacterium]|nr:hypothetical protein [Verrucomicrobiota bacterium]MBS0645965.1 hypothetical protein [Verrucomicrobiota bacterium]